MIKHKHRLERKYRKYPITYGAESRCLRNRVKNLMAKAKNLYSTNKPKASWDVTSEVLGNAKTEHSTSDLFIDSITCNDDGIKGNHANDFSTYVGHNLGQQFFNEDYFFFIFSKQC